MDDKSGLKQTEQKEFMMFKKIIPMLMAWGIPFWIAGMIQAPITLIEAFAIYQLYTGNQMGGMV